MGKVVPLPERVPLVVSPEVGLPIEMLVRGDLNPALYYACSRVAKHKSLSDEAGKLVIDIIKLVENRDVSATVLALYGCLDIVSASWIKHAGGEKWCSTGSSARLKEPASTSSPWSRWLSFSPLRALRSLFRRSSAKDR